jgi:uncharacterized membrane protein
MEKFSFNKSRIVGFSDAVFGIAMTLLVLEIAVPTYEAINQFGLRDVLAKRTPNFIGFIVSFFVSAMYWMDYLKITKYISKFSTKALWANIFLLFFVVLLPFSTALYVNGIKFIGSFVFYSINLALIAVMTLILLLIIAKEEHGKKGITRMTRNWLSLKIINTILIWALATVLAFVSIKIARFVWILIFVIDPIIDWYYKKKLQKNS